MWSWLQKLIRYLQGEDDEQQKSARLSVPPGQLQAKTKRIYPRERMSELPASTSRREKERQFRFPVIPDEPSRKLKREQASVPVEEQPVAVHKATAGPAFVEKRPYKPTEVISPIYGKVDSPSQPRVERQRNAETEARPQAVTAAEVTSGKKEAAASIPAVSKEPVVSGPDLVEQDTVEDVAVTPDVDEQDVREPVLEPVPEEESMPAENPVVDQPKNDGTNGQWPEEPQTGESAVEEPHADAESAAKQEEPTARQTGAGEETSERTISEERVAEPEPERPVYMPVSPPQPSAQSRVAEEPVSRTVESVSHYELPSLSLLNPSPSLSEDDYEYTLDQKQLLEETLSNFNVSAQVVGIVKGPSVTRFELQPAPGVKVNKITGLIDDIKLNMAAKDIRIEAPIPGRNAVGIEVPNLKSEPVFISRIIGSEKFLNHPSPLAVALGMDIGGDPIVADIKKMPHGLIAGATGSGKSVCINSIIVSLLYKASPEQVRLLLIDPKMVELAPYNHLPHLVTPVVTDAKQATAALKWAVEEMEKRYALFVDAGVRDIDRYNLTTDEPLPYIVIVIDELADLMMVSPQDVEDCIIRIAQKARACGIHLLLATQRPSVDVITGNIKANVPTRLAFAVFSQVDSRTILDQSGAERLLGRGDMLFLESGATPVRLQGNYVSDDEIERVTNMIKKQRKPEYYFSKEDLEQQVQSYDMGDDPLYHEALLFVAEQGQASASALQRRFRIGYNRAARLIEMMEGEGHVAGQSGGKPRAVLITREDAQALAEGSTLL
jgi:S-DNA-T family DNA segregation ATPase FtsK/SpoIIIE